MLTSIVLVNLIALATPALQEAACVQLREISLPNTTVVTTELVPAGPYTTQRGRAELTVELPAHCRAAIILAPSADSSIEMEIWLPVQTWNGKFSSRWQRRLGRVYLLSGHGVGPEGGVCHRL